MPLTARDVGGIIQRGGTMLGSARCPEFAREETRRTAIDALARWGVDALIVIGGNGSQAGARALAQMGLPVVGVASTIDNDLCGSDITIGVDTALNIALEAIDRLKLVSRHHVRVVRGIRPRIPANGDVPKLAGVASRVHLDQLVQLPAGARGELRVRVVFRTDLGAAVQRAQRTGHEMRTPGCRPAQGDPEAAFLRSGMSSPPSSQFGRCSRARTHARQSPESDVTNGNMRIRS